MKKFLKEIFVNRILCCLVYLALVPIIAIITVLSAVSCLFVGEEKTDEIQTTIFDLR